jgi:hypothetical protein
MKLPNLDTAHKLLKQLKPKELETVKKSMIVQLITRKVLHKFRLLGHYFNIAIDGTGIHSYSYEPYEECPFKESKRGKKTWLLQVLEAKIVCGNGFSISICTEWVRNTRDGTFDKQDCELKAFARLADKLKKSFPRLPICITADGLYPNNTVFDICENNNWKYIITLKEGNLKTVWEEITFLERIKDNIKAEKTKLAPLAKTTGQYFAYKEIEYQKHALSIVDCQEKLIKIKNKELKSSKRFVHVTNIGLSKDKIIELSDAGRLRWRIENEGFNEQKNGGYKLEHKYARKDFNATRNYYQCLQIAHMINQLAYKTKVMEAIIKEEKTVKSLLEEMIAIIMVADLSEHELITKAIEQNCQFRY